MRFLLLLLPLPAMWFWFRHPFDEDHPIYGRLLAALLASFFVGSTIYSGAVQDVLNEPVLIRTLQVILVTLVVLGLVAQPPKALYGLLLGLGFGMLVLAGFAGLVIACYYIWTGAFPDDIPLTRAIGVLTLPLAMLIGSCVSLIQRPRTTSSESRSKWTSVIPAICSILVAMCAVVTLLLRFRKEIVEIILQ
jgi:hypothetical protein